MGVGGGTEQGKHMPRSRTEVQKSEINSAILSSEKSIKFNLSKIEATQK